MRLTHEAGSSPKPPAALASARETRELLAPIEAPIQERFHVAEHSIIVNTYTLRQASNSLRLLTPHPWMTAVVCCLLCLAGKLIILSRVVEKNNERGVQFYVNNERGVSILLVAGFVLRASVRVETPGDLNSFQTRIRADGWISPGWLVGTYCPSTHILGIYSRDYTTCVLKIYIPKFTQRLLRPRYVQPKWSNETPKGTLASSVFHKQPSAEAETGLTYGAE